MAKTESARKRERDATLDRACRAYQATGSTRKAAALAGISHRTLARMVASAGGAARLAELRVSDGPDLANECRDIAREYLASVRADLNNPDRAAKITTKDKAWIAAVMIDKAKILEAPAQTAEGAWEVSVRFGGARVAATNGAPTIEAAAAQVSVRSGA